MFVDESGTARIPNAAARDDVVYIQCGLIVNAGDVHRARAAVDRAKRELFRGKDPMKWELHGYEIWRSRGRFADDLCIPCNEKLDVFARSVEAIEESGAVVVSVKHYAGNALFGGLFDALMPCMWQRDGNLEGFGIKHYPDRR